MKKLAFGKLESFCQSKEMNIQTGPFGTQLKASEYVKEGIPVINVRNIGYRSEKEADLEYLDDKKADKLSQHKLREKDIVFGRKGAVDRHIFVKKKHSGWIQGSDCIRIRFNSSKIDPSFLSHFFLTEGHKKWMEAQGAFGATMGSLNQGIIQRISYPLFPILIQKKIDTILSIYDDFIENNNNRISILEKMAEDLYREWFVRLRFPEHEKSKIVKGIPEGWEAKRVCDLIKRIPAGKKYEDKTVFLEGRVPVLDQGQTGIIGYHNNEPAIQASFDKPVIVFANHTCYQRIIFYSFSMIQNVLPFESNEIFPSNIYWLHYATKDLIKFSEYKGHWPEFNKKFLYYPEKALTEKFGSIVKPILMNIFLIQNKNRILIQARDKLLSRLMSGKIDVENLDIKFPASMQENENN